MNKRHEKLLQISPESAIWRFSPASFFYYMLCLLWEKHTPERDVNLRDPELSEAVLVVFVPTLASPAAPPPATGLPLFSFDGGSILTVILICHPSVCIFWVVLVQYLLVARTSDVSLQVADELIVLRACCQC